ncbi:MAG: hypothetical protein VST68_06055 [Nitrospirota bacterium]|nr:hypothetical protein [Nitrospirota bacterium]
MDKLIAKIGKGLRGAKDLTWEEAKEAVASLIEGQATPHQVGAFLMAMRIKTETVTEMAAFTSKVRTYVPPVKIPVDRNVVDVPVYGEKHNTFHACVPSAIVAAAAGASVLLHGMDNPACASDLPRVLNSLNIPTKLQGEALGTTIEEQGFGFLDLAIYHPPLASFLDLRHELGVQNFFHQVVRLLNPSRSSSQVIGVTHPPYLEKIPEAVNMMGGHRVMVFQGVEGYPELSISTPTLLRELRNERFIPFNLKPQHIRLSLGSFQNMTIPVNTPANEVPTQEAALIRKILSNEIQDSARDWVVYNAAMLLYAGSQASTISAGVPLAIQSLESGAAAKKLASLAVSSAADDTNDLGKKKEIVHA